MTVRHIAGLDISTSRIGYAAPDGTLRSITSRAGAQDPVRRLHELETALMSQVRLYPPAPDYVVIEGYSLGGPTNRASTRIVLGEVGGVIRLALWRAGIEFVAVPPTSLKRFATGKGNADKLMMTEAAKRDGARPSNDDEADAHHLRMMGRAAHGLDVVEEPHQLDAISGSNVVW